VIPPCWGFYLRQITADVLFAIYNQTTRVAKT